MHGYIHKRTNYIQTYYMAVNDFRLVVTFCRVNKIIQMPTLSKNLHKLEIKQACKNPAPNACILKIY